jgi:hypothetical protein
MLIWLRIWSSSKRAGSPRAGTVIFRRILLTPEARLDGIAAGGC